MCRDAQAWEYPCLLGMDNCKRTPEINNGFYVLFTMILCCKVGCVNFKLTPRSWSLPTKAKHFH